MKRFFVSSLLFTSVLFYTFAVQGPKLRLIKAYVDLGSLEEDQGSIDFEIFYTNIGNSPLYLTETKAFCPCIKTDISTEALVPGDTASIKVNYSFNQVGEFRNPIRIFYNTENPDFFDTVTFFGEVIEKKDESEDTFY